MHKSEYGPPRGALRASTSNFSRIGTVSGEFSSSAISYSKKKGVLTSLRVEGTKSVWTRKSDAAILGGSTQTFAANCVRKESSPSRGTLRKRMSSLVFRGNGPRREEQEECEWGFVHRNEYLFQNQSQGVGEIIRYPREKLGPEARKASGRILFVRKGRSS